MKQKLLNSLKALPISQKDKESFIDTILDLAKSNGGGISFSYFKYSAQYIYYFRFYGILYGKYDDSNNKGIFPYFMYEKNDISTPPKYIAILNDGQDISVEDGTVINKGESIYDFIKNIDEIEVIPIEDINAILSTLKSLEITEEEFYNFN